MQVEYKTKGTCAKRIFFTIENNVISDIRFESGCDGNLKAVSSLADGLTAEELLKRCEGIDCDGRGTSCADQLAKAVRANLSKT
ncbi:TSCPD domain-containing protein [Clostridia bacterium]|nr:TSCPD domain-containing protein [Clostridia bacterium]